MSLRGLQSWEQIGPECERIRVEEGFIYRTWTWTKREQHHFGFFIFDWTSLQVSRENVKTFFVPDSNTI